MCLILWRSRSRSPCISSSTRILGHPSVADMFIYSVYFLAVALVLDDVLLQESCRFRPGDVSMRCFNMTASCVHRGRTQFLRSAAWEFHSSTDALGSWRLWQCSALPSWPCQDSTPKPPCCSRVSPLASLLVLLSYLLHHPMAGNS